MVTPSELAKGQDDATEPELTAADLRDAEGSWLRNFAPRSMVRLPLRSSLLFAELRMA